MNNFKHITAALVLLALFSCESEELVEPKEETQQNSIQKQTTNTVQAQSPFRTPSNCEEDFGLCSVEYYDGDHWEVILEEPQETDDGEGNMVVGIPVEPAHAEDELVIDANFLLDEEIAEDLNYEELEILEGSYEVEDASYADWESVTTVNIRGHRLNKE